MPLPVEGQQRFGRSQGRCESDRLANLQWANLFQV